MGAAGLGALFAGAFGLAALLAWPLQRWLRRKRMVDLPGDRRSHDQPTPRGGGLAIIATLLIAWLAWPGAFAAWWLPMGATVAMAAVGWSEDRLELTARFRFFAQVAVATLLVVGAGGLEVILVFGQRLEAQWALSALGVVATVWLINLHNFMDGADGLASAQAAWVGAAYAALFALSGLTELAALALAACGAWSGFLVWNRPPARLFMGDVGSLALGALVAAFAVIGAAAEAISIWVSFMISSVFVVDATATLVRRVVRGERWYTPHRQHAYQRLLVRGWSHGRVLRLYALINVLVVFPVLAAAWRWPHLDTWLAVGLTALLALGWQVVQSATTSKNDKASL